MTRAGRCAIRRPVGSRSCPPTLRSKPSRWNVRSPGDEVEVSCTSASGGCWIRQQGRSRRHDVHRRLRLGPPLLDGIGGPETLDSTDTAAPDDLTSFCRVPVPLREAAP
jgi:hypothetical protein